MAATAKRINYLHVMTQVNGGAPRMIQAKAGKYDQKYVCQCPKGATGQCSHVTALYTLLHQEAAMLTAGQLVPANV